MRALACVLLKLCCIDIHIEYPIPESYFIPDYSRSEIRAVHPVVFENFKNNIALDKNKYKLNE